MKATSVALRAHLDETVTTLATLWRVTRQDDQEFFFTDHDVDIVFDGNTYAAATGYTRSAIQNDSTMAVDNADLDGILDSVQITETDLRAGLFDYADVRVSLVNWSDLTQGELKVRRGRLGEVITGRTGTYHAELRGMLQAYAQNLLELYQPECQADLGDARCKIAIKPDLLPRSFAVAVGDAYYVNTDPGPTAYSDQATNSGFEATGALSLVTTGITGWTVTAGNWSVVTVSTGGGLAPFAGTKFLEGGSSSSGSIRQDVSLAAILTDATHVDDGFVSASFSIRRANGAVDDTGRVRVQALTSALAVISTLYDSGAEEISPIDTWVARTMPATLLPATTRYLRIILDYTKVTGGIADSEFDAAILDIEDVFSDSCEAFENRVYRVTQAGTTAATQPTYDTTIGNDTTDGTAVLTAENAFRRSAEVDTVTSRRVFTIIVDEARAVDDWFNGGGCLFETGANAGRTIEVKDWVQSSNTVTLFLPAPFTVAPGDKLCIYAGCDKKRQTCFDKFANVINFRGFPDLPGLDNILRYPDAR